MKKLILSQAAAYAKHYIQGLEDVHDEDYMEDREDELSALIYISRYTKSAREVVGAIKLLKIFDILRAKTISIPDGWGYVYKGLHPQDVDEIKRIVCEGPRMMGYKGDQDARL